MYLVYTCNYCTGLVGSPHQKRFMLYHDIFKIHFWLVAKSLTYVSMSWLHLIGHWRHTCKQCILWSHDHLLYHVISQIPVRVLQVLYCTVHSTHVRDWQHVCSSHQCGHSETWGTFINTFPMITLDDHRMNITAAMVESGQLLTFVSTLKELGARKYK